MRNGNGEDWKDATATFAVLILPMRNGNSYTAAVVALANIRSYPTYEEWKLQIKNGIPKNIIAFLSYL